MKIPLIIVPIMGDTVDMMKRNMDEALENIPDKFYLFEQRIDSPKERLSYPDIDSLLGHSEKGSLVTDRREGEGRCEKGFYRTDEERMDNLAYAALKGAWGIDAEHSTPQDELYRLVDMLNNIRSHKKDNSTKVIISAHDLKKTPNLVNLVGELKEVGKLFKDFEVIYKAAVKAEGLEDIHLMGSVVDRVKDDFTGLSITKDPALIKAAADYTRKNMNNYFTFGPYREGKGSADGQPTAVELYDHFSRQIETFIK